LLAVLQFCAGESSDLSLNTGYKIPLVGLGTYKIEEKVSEVVDLALSADYRLFDSAQFYKNEHLLGQAFEDLLPNYNLTREDIFITTKIIPQTKYETEADYEELVRGSLRNLKTDYIDLYLIHWPGVLGLPNNSTEILKYRHVAWKALTKCHKSGLIRSIGVSNFLVKHLENLKTVSDVIPAVNQVQWHPKSYSNELLEYCKSNNIVLQAYSSLGSSRDSALRDDPTVVTIASKLGKSPSQVLLRWATQNNIPVIPKASSKKHIEENFDLDFTIPDEDMQTLNSMQQEERKIWNPKDVV